jgi:hypothetical protein
MFKKLYDKWFKKKKPFDRQGTIEKLNEALYPSDNLKVVYEEITQYEIKGVMYHLGDKVIARSNECDPLVVGEIVEFWNNDGKWSNCIPQIKDDLDGTVWSHMGTVVHYTDELFKILEPMRPLEQWNYLLPDNVKEMYSYTEEQMDKKEKQYKMVQKKKNLIES